MYCRMCRCKLLCFRLPLFTKYEFVNITIFQHIRYGIVIFYKWFMFLTNSTEKVYVFVCVCVVSVVLELFCVKMRITVGKTWYSKIWWNFLYIRARYREEGLDIREFLIWYKGISLISGPDIREIPLYLDSKHNFLCIYFDFFAQKNETNVEKT